MNTFGRPSIIFKKYSNNFLIFFFIIKNNLFKFIKIKLLKLNIIFFSVLNKFSI